MTPTRARQTRRRLWRETVRIVRSPLQAARVAWHTQLLEVVAGVGVAVEVALLLHQGLLHLRSARRQVSWQREAACASGTLRR